MDNTDKKYEKTIQRTTLLHVDGKDILIVPEDYSNPGNLEVMMCSKSLDMVLISKKGKTEEEIQEIKWALAQNLRYYDGFKVDDCIIVF